MSQAQFLGQWGIDDLVREGVAYWENMTGAPDIAAIKMRSRKNESHCLKSKTGLGSFSAMIWTAAA
jgi:hypothetical protein